MFHLLFPRGLQLYRIKSLHPPTHAVTDVLLRDTVKGTLCVYMFLDAHEEELEKIMWCSMQS
jgi:hypothetical protein